jgi:hypothetical protein
MMSLGGVVMLNALALLALLAGSVCQIEHLALSLPAAYVCEKQSGPDFTVFYIHPVGNSPTASIGVYIGNFPTSFAPKTGVTKEGAVLGQTKAEWKLWLEPQEGGGTAYLAELSVVRPFGTEPRWATVLHLFVSAATSEQRADLQRIALAIRPVAQAPR